MTSCSEFNELKLLSLKAIVPPIPLIRRRLEDFTMLLVEPCLLMATLVSLSVDDSSENMADSVCVNVRYSSLTSLSIVSAILFASELRRVFEPRLLAFEWFRFNFVRAVLLAVFAVPVGTEVLLRLLLLDLLALFTLMAFSF